MGTRRLAACAVLVGLLSLAVTGSAQALSRGTYRVTLPTGDRVVLTVASDGKQSLTVDRSGNATRSFHTVQQDGEVYAYPVELAPYLGNLLDRNLFNVTRLVEQGHSDRASGSIPLIVTHESGRRTLPDAVERTATLQSIDATAGRESKARADDLGRALREQLAADAAKRSGPLDGIETIYLDEKVKANLADSVPRIGAPQAWDAGFDGAGVDVAILDTGADTTHPDLEGKVGAQENFTPEASPVDGNGHGTHVAATVAGTGDGSAGSRKGVAPGARLMNGKVLDRTGGGQVSWVIEGMEWAAANGAEVISMSLGAGPTDGTDPLSQAVNELTESTGVLFTIAAGNSGANQTISSPGTATSALTVGAVDKSDVLAGFSSRGPRLGDFAIKPDVTAPGVGIVAARATGTSLGAPVDDLYTMLSGTSMATPHVAGAAAILKQEFPGWTPAQIKAALVSTAAPGSYTVYQQGGGRVDVARAFAQRVYASGPVDFGYFRWPHDGADPVTKPITYTNQMGAAVTLDLAVDVKDGAGTPGAAGLVTPGASSVTIPAGGTATVDVSVDRRLGAPGLYGGAVTGRSADGTIVVRTPIGFYKEPETYDLRLEGIARDGRPAVGSWIEVVDTEDTTRFGKFVFLNGNPETIRVPRGNYSVIGTLLTYDQPQVWAIEVAVAGDPEVDVTRDTSMVVDGRKATEVIADIDRRSEVKSSVVGAFRSGSANGAWESLLLLSSPVDRVFAAPTEQVTKGGFAFRTKKVIGAPEIEVSVTRPESIPLKVRYASPTAKVDGREQRQLVYAGIGRPEDFRGRDVRGKAVLISRDGTLTFAEKVANATAAGAAAVIIHNNQPGLLLVGLESSEIPVLTLSQSQGELLQDLLEDGPVRISLQGVVNSPFLYDVLFAERGRILETHRRTFDNTNTFRLNTDYRADRDGQPAAEAHHTYPAWSGFSAEFSRNFPTPFSRTEYVSTGDARWSHFGWSQMTQDLPFAGQIVEPVRSYPARGAAARDWFIQPQRPSVIRAFEVGADNGSPVTRENNVISAYVPDFEDAEGRIGFADARTDTSDFRLYEDGELIAQKPFGFIGGFAVKDEPATYRAELDVKRRAPYWRYSTDTETAWTFRSGPGEGRQTLPLLLADYDVGDLDTLNRAPRGNYEIGLRIRRQQGAPAAAVTDLKVWASFDQGGTWSRLGVEDLGSGNVAAALTHPARQTARDVSLRVQASDAGGSRLTQTIIKAYGLR